MSFPNNLERYGQGIQSALQQQVGESFEPFSNSDDLSLSVKAQSSLANAGAWKQVLKPDKLQSFRVVNEQGHLVGSSKADEHAGGIQPIIVRRTRTTVKRGRLPEITGIAGLVDDDVAFTKQPQEVCVSHTNATENADELTRKKPGRKELKLEAAQPHTNKRAWARSDPHASAGQKLKGKQSKQSLNEKKVKGKHSKQSLHGEKVKDQPSKQSLTGKKVKDQLIHDVIESEYFESESSKVESYLSGVMSQKRVPAAATASKVDKMELAAPKAVAAEAALAGSKMASATLEAAAKEAAAAGSKSTSAKPEAATVVAAVEAVEAAAVSKVASATSGAAAKEAEVAKEGLFGSWIRAPAPQNELLAADKLATLDDEISNVTLSLSASHPSAVVKKTSATSEAAAVTALMNPQGKLTSNTGSLIHHLASVSKNSSGVTSILSELKSLESQQSSVQELPKKSSSWWSSATASSPAKTSVKPAESVQSVNPEESRTSRQLMRSPHALDSLAPSEADSMTTVDTDDTTEDERSAATAASGLKVRRKSKRRLPSRGEEKMRKPSSHKRTKSHQKRHKERCKIENRDPKRPRSSSSKRDRHRSRYHTDEERQSPHASNSESLTQHDKLTKDYSEKGKRRSRKSRGKSDRHRHRNEDSESSFGTDTGGAEDDE